MSELLNKFKQLCNSTITLPDNGEITLSKINVDFQSKLHNTLGNFTDDNSTIVLKYLQYINEYIINIDLSREFTLKDKLWIIHFWRKDIINTEEELDIESLKVIDNLKDCTIKFTLNKLETTVKLTQSTLIHENNIIDLLLNQDKELNETDVLFFDAFRFLDVITIDSKDYKISNLTIEELYQLYLLFNVDDIKKILQNINITLEDISNIKSIEGDFSSFY